MSRVWDRIVWLFGAKPSRVWVYDPANNNSTHNTNGRITPPKWAENVGKQWSRRPRRRRIITITVIVLLLLASVLTGLGVWQYQRVTEARTVCENTRTSVTAELTALHDTVQSERVVTALAITTDEVLDAATVSTLAEAADTASESVSLPACEVGFFTLHPDQAADVFTEPASLIASRAQALDDAVTAVTVSRDDKVLADAQTALNDTLTEASELLESSKGEVADNSTRTALKTAITEAQTLLDDATESDPDVYAEYQATVEAAMTTVSKSVKAQQKAEAAAAAAAAASSSSSSSGSSSSSSSSSGSSSGSYSGSSSSGSSSSGSSSSSSSGGSSGSSSSCYVCSLSSAIGGSNNPDMQVDYGGDNGEPNI